MKLICRIFSAVVLSLAVLASCSDASQMYVPEGYELVWSDEFDGDVLNRDYWTPEIGHGQGGWGNAELQDYTDR